eukprot:10297641-Alexandrium_andersonii.AAC.1
MTLVHLLRLTAARSHKHPSGPFAEPSGHVGLRNPARAWAGLSPGGARSPEMRRIPGAPRKPWRGATGPKGWRRAQA